MITEEDWTYIEYLRDNAEDTQTLKDYDKELEDGKVEPDDHEQAEKNTGEVLRNLPTGDEKWLNIQTKNTHRK